MQVVAVAQQMDTRALGEGSVDLQLSAPWDHDGSLFLFPVAGVWSNSEFYVAVAELLTLCSQV